jgi:hypothetical protein
MVGSLFTISWAAIFAENNKMSNPETNRVFKFFIG